MIDAHALERVAFGSLPVIEGAHLFHVGLVAESIDVAMREMSQSRGLSWKGGDRCDIDVTIDGTPRRIPMRIAHSVQGPPHIELIEAVPGTPWASAHHQGVHHLCYWSEDPEAACARLKESGSKRVIGAADACTGYFRLPSGMFIEVIDPPLRDQLSRWIASATP